MKASILIATFGRPDMLTNTLRRIHQSILASQSQEVTVVVVENGERAGGEAICKTLAEEGLNLRYFFSEPANKSCALNFALPFCSEGLVIMTDDDVEVPLNFVGEYLKAAQGKEGGVFFGGATNVVYEKEPSLALKKYLPISALGTVNKGRPNLFLGFNWAAFKCDLINAGGFNPDHGPGSFTGATGQETEMQRRLLAAGCSSFYIEAIVVDHYVPKERSSMDWVAARSYKQGVERGLLLKDSTQVERAKILISHFARVVLNQVKLLANRSEWQRLKYRHSKNRFEGYRFAFSLLKAGSTSLPPHFKTSDVA